MKAKEYLKRILIAADQLINTLACGYPDETISSRSYRWDISGKRHWPRALIDKVAGFFGDKDHCYESFISERLGRQLPPEARP